MLFEGFQGSSPEEMDKFLFERLFKAGKDKQPVPFVLIEERAARLLYPLWAKQRGLTPNHIFYTMYGHSLVVHPDYTRLYGTAPEKKIERN